MTRSSSSARLALAAAIVSAALLPACSKSKPTMDLPVYPGSVQASGFPNQETAEGTLYRVRRRTPDGVRTVSDFYRKELVEGRGWQEVSSIGPAFQDGNLRVARPGQGAGTAEPIDPTRAGGFVVVFEVDNATYVEMWQHVPPAQ